MSLDKIEGRFSASLNWFKSQFKSKEELNLLDGPVGKNLFYLSLPVIVINLLQTMYNLADTFWLGQYSNGALEAITYAFPLVFFLISLGMGLAVAGSVLVAQNEGSGNRKKRNYAASQTIMFSALASVIIGAVGFLFIGDFVPLLGASGQVAAAATSYLQVISLGLFSMFGFLVFQSLMRGYGDTVTPMLLMLGTVILNIIIDPLFIFGAGPIPELGVTGAAIATVFARSLSLIIGVYILFTGSKGIQISLSQMKPDLSFFKKMIGIGIPASAEQTGRSISVNALVAVVGVIFAGTVVAGYGIAVRIFSMVFLPAAAVGRGVESMTGQNLGAGNYDRAAETARFGAKWTFIILTALGAVTFLFAQPISSVFTKSTEIASVSAEFLRYVSFSFGFIGVLRAYNGSFRGAGKTLTAAAISITTLAVIRLPIAYFGALEIGTEGVWIAFFISNVGGALIAYLWYQRGTWRQKLTEKQEAQGETAEEAEGFGETITETAVAKINNLISGSAARE
ncbi:MATE family efflux transporter [Candidatus Nanohalobium constans]|uniref:MATE family efflux transporter n=1 Tax=Candidatus Nanohalobium constans TaxID=2565781 RepID=A0A5Q0UF41_9ARCH|nr:MATE family efflux transporter [Candidatus Nanohalobium constans]QGA80166.1 MATE family efflux transporter [Candidatus Nanohalobium constans]